MMTAFYRRPSSGRNSRAGRDDCTVGPQTQASTYEVICPKPRVRVHDVEVTHIMKCVGATLFDAEYVEGKTDIEELVSQIYKAMRAVSD